MHKIEHKKREQFRSDLHRIQQGVMTVGLGFRLFMETEKGAKPFEECTEEELQTFKVNAEKRLSDTMSRYYTQHTDEYEKI
jgi:hypothetical protein